MSVKFRQLRKEQLAGMVPIHVATKVRHLAATERMTISATMSLLLARALSMDPAMFGLPVRRGQDQIQAD